MFIGQYRYNVDEKGRIVIPIEFRKQFGGAVIVNKGFERCITIYTTSDWNKAVEKITSLSFTKSANRKFSRYFMSSAFQKEVDNQGRINLDDCLIEHAKITKECVIAGVGNMIEIWSKEEWDIVEANRLDEFDELGEEIDL